LRAIVRQHPHTLRALLLTVLTLPLLALGGTEHAQSWTGGLLALLGLVWIGLPHGAVDHLLETGSLQPQKLPRFVAHYLGLAAAMGVVWILAPLAGLALFLIYSAGHFGQADGQTWGWRAPRSWAWGASVLFYLLATHVPETSAIVHALCGLHWTLALPPWTLLLWLPVAFKEKNTSWQITLLWLILSAWLPLLLAFGLYFIGQHSWNGWTHLQRGTGRTARALWLQSLPFHLGAWLLLGLALWLWPQFSPFSPSPTVPAAAAPFFVFLSCISFPPVWAMHRFYGRWASQNR
jgi:Brp/Blh family beta-carotene 15,15'-monooxygenase